MIRIEQLDINEFRGIRNLTFNMGGSNFAVCGPNGTGKSGIVDSIEFALTGNVSRLSGEGTGNLSIKDHGPHVDCTDPDKAAVTLSFEIVSSGKRATIHRTVKDSKKPTITPADDDVLEVLSHIERHPEFVLSRRELIKYVLSNPGDRAKEVQALLRLNKLETTRANLQKISNAEKRSEGPLEKQKQVAKAGLLTALEIDKLGKEEVLEEVNQRRKTLSLPEIEELKADTSFKEGIADGAGDATKPKVSKVQALSDIKSLEEGLGELLNEEFSQSYTSFIEHVSKLADDPLLDKAVSTKNMLDVALDLFDEEHCPVCDTGWESQNFIALVKSKLQNLEKIKTKKEELETSSREILSIVAPVVDKLSLVSRYGALLPGSINVESLTEYRETLNSLNTVLRNIFPLSHSKSLLITELSPDKSVEEIIANLKKSAESLPEPSKQDSAREFLIITHERMEAYRNASASLNECKKRAEIAEHVHELYGQVMTTELENVYKSVEKTFRNLYRVINSDDESAFEAKLTPSLGKLGFDVDFYGRGYFPPGAFHSEGHQDSMGLCLYLALMQHLLSDGFNFSVLDDVLMSVDAGHRREVCTLLKQKFPNTQFMLTTHDDIWLRHMKTAGLIQRNGFVHFRTWTVDVGPTEWDDRDVWKEIEDHIEENNIRDAAALLRHYLEYLSKEMCHRLRAPVVFRGDAQYTLGELLPPGVKRLREFFKQGIKTAKSWSQDDNAEKIEELFKQLNETAQNSEVEQWQINTAIHYNEWENLNKNDFKPVVEAFKKLILMFECETCQELLYISPEKGNKEALRCGCGVININLIKKN